MEKMIGLDMDTEVVMSPAARAAVFSSPYSSPNTAFLLQRRVLTWYVRMLSQRFQL
jgi:hypothetical protein